MRDLKGIFTNVEELENLDSLFSIFFIMKYLLSLGDTKLIETLLSNDFYLFTFGALECKQRLIQ